MMQMKLHCIVRGRLGFNYEKLVGMQEKGGRPRGRVKRTTRRFRGIRLSRSRKLTLKAVSVIMSARICRIYNDIANRMNVDGICPAIIFSSQWGLPVLSHSMKSRKECRLPW